MLSFLEGGGIFLMIPLGMYLLFALVGRMMGASTAAYRPHEVGDIGPIDREKASRFVYTPTPVKPEDLRDDEFRYEPQVSSYEPWNPGASEQS